MSVPHKKVRTRFAPSPTGYMHIGNLRTALYAYLVAKSQGGDFILRIEDTDQERYIEGAADVIIQTLHDTGLIYDEGPDIGGDYGPYIQSQRRELYRQYAEQLVAEGKAYYCFCDKQRLDRVREEMTKNHQPPKYDGHCRNLTAEQVREKLAAGVPYVIREKMPTSGATTFSDEVYGDITVENETLDDQILLKSDGLPTYNFANVVDDHLMGITHVIRGSEYLSSSPKYNLLYEAFGWDIPVYIHCPPVMKDANHKLSKRDGDASFQDIVARGYLKEAVLNYIALLGWSSGSEREKFTLAELIDCFDAKHISKSPAIFDIEKLTWLNGEYIRAMSPEQFYQAAKPYLEQGVKNPAIDLRYVATLLQPRCEKLTDIPEQLDFIDTLPDYDTDLFVHKKMKTTKELAADILAKLLPVVEQMTDLSVAGIHDTLFAFIGELGVKNGQVLFPLRVALSGKAFTPGGSVELLHVLGKEEALRRIRVALDKLSA